MTQHASSVVKLDDAVLPEVRRMYSISLRARRDAEYAVATLQLIDTALRDLLERSTGLDLQAVTYQLDPKKGYLIPQQTTLPEEEERNHFPSPAPVTSDEPTPISLTERRKTRKRSSPVR